ncbi:MAG: hypothetical protein AAF701_09380, partial [Pseudomonadota bacterium]
MGSSTQVRLADRTIQVNENTLQFPILAALDSENTILNYANIQPNSRTTLAELAAQVPAGDRMLWIDACKTLQHMAPEKKFGLSQFCVMAGTVGSDHFDVWRLRDTLAEQVAFLDADHSVTPAQTIAHANLFDDTLLYTGVKPHVFQVPTTLYDGPARLIRSASKDNGTSATYEPVTTDMYSGTWAQMDRGVNIHGLTGEGRWQLVQNYDVCAPDGLPDPNQVIAQLEAGKVQYEFMTIAVHDTAWCAPDQANFTLISEMLGLKTLNDIGKRQAYFALLERGKGPQEMLARPDESFLVALQTTKTDGMPALENRGMVKVALAPRVASIPSAPIMVDMPLLLENAQNGTCISPP